MNSETLEEIHTEIKSQLKKFVDYANSKNIDAMIELFTDDGFVVSELGKIEGRENLRTLYKGFMAPVKDVGIYSKQIYAIGEKIYEMGTNRVVAIEDGRETEVKGNYITIWKKENGQWKISEDLIPPMPE